MCGRLEGMIGSDAKDRLMNLLENNPELFSKAMKKHIAGFLGIDQSTLSRLLSGQGQRTRLPITALTTIPAMDIPKIAVIWHIEPLI